MSVIGEIGVTLQAMDVWQQTLLFLFLMSYPWALGSLFAARGRRIAAAVAAGSMIGFVGMTDPWLHGALFAVAVVASMGLFIAAAWSIDRVPRLVDRPVVFPSRREAQAPLSSPDLERAAARRPELPLTGHAGST